MGKFIDTCPLCEKEFLNDNTVAGFKYYCSGGCAVDAKSLVNNEDDITQPNLFEIDDDPTPGVDTMNRLSMMVSGTINNMIKTNRSKLLDENQQ